MSEPLRPDWHAGPGRVSPIKRLRRLRPRARPRFRGPSFNRIVPNLLTLLGLCAGLTSMRFAYEGRFGPRRWRWWSPVRSTGWTAGWRGC